MATKKQEQYGNSSISMLKGEDRVRKRPAKKQEQYGNSSISMLKGEDRVRKRPAVIFGSDDLEGCKHAVFEILSNAIDEAREGHGDTILVTRYEDLSVEVEDFGRGCPVDYNEKEKRYNWELVFCEMYAGGKYGENGENYEYSLGLNGLGSCATQYASEFFDATIHRDGFRYDLHFEKGRNVGGLKKEPTTRRKTGSRFHWKPDKQVFTDINIPVEYYRDVLRRQAVVNQGITFQFRNQVGGKFETEEFCYADGIRQCAAPPGGGEPGHYVPVPQPGGGQVRDGGILLRRRHPPVYRGAGGGQCFHHARFLGDGAPGPGCRKPAGDEAENHRFLLLLQAGQPH